MAHKHRKPSAPLLHELESLVMEEVWRQEQATVREVLTALNRGEKERAYTTVMTIMARLDEKGILTRERRGKTDVYEPVLSREQFMEARAGDEVQSLIREFGDIALAHFAEEVGNLDPKRLEALRKLAGHE